MDAVVDDLGRAVPLHAPARRIVSLVPSLTECLFTLGAGEAVVACTRWCTDPPDRVCDLPKVGGTKNADVAAIVALAPDLVVMNSEENRREHYDALVAAGLTVFVTEPKTVEGALDLVARLGAIAGRGEAGRHLAAEQRVRIAGALAPSARLPTAVAPGGTRRPVRYFCPIWKKPWMAFNQDTYAHDVLRVAGGANVVADAAERYPRITLDDIAARAPEIVLLPDEPYTFGEDDVADLAPLAETPALRDGRVHLVDGKALSWYGPRTADGVLMFAELFARAR
jgi:ABC-type hemin transport system substrate-binding protein